MVYTVEQIRRIAAPIAAAYGVKNLYLFGSYARGDATESIDIDLLVDRTGMRGGWAIGGLYADLADALGKKLDLVTTSGAEAGFLNAIAADTIRLYERQSS